MSLYAKRLERGRFLWPSPADGIVAISAAQLAYMLDGPCQDNRMTREQVATTLIGYGTLIPPSPVSTGSHPACRLALPALHAQLPRRRGSPRRAWARYLLRNRPELGAEVRTGDRAAAAAGPPSPERSMGVVKLNNRSGKSGRIDVSILQPSLPRMQPFLVPKT